MDIESKHFYWAVTVVMVSFFLVLGFGNCDQSGTFKRYKVCMETIKDQKVCDPYPSNKTEPILTPTPGAK